MGVFTECHSTAAFPAGRAAPGAFRAWNRTGFIKLWDVVFMGNHDWLDTRFLSRTFSQSDPMSTAAATSTGDPSFFEFRPRDTYPPIRPSDILRLWEGSWGRGRSGFLASPDLRTYFFDPAFHPATAAELEKWVNTEIDELVEDRIRIRRDRVNNERILMDCEDSAFRLKSAASSYVRSKLSAPLCVGIMACQSVKTKGDHVVNWFVSADRKDAASRSYDFQLWFTDVRTCVDARVRAREARARGKRSAKGTMVELEAPFVPREKAFRCLTKPYLIFA